MLDKYFSKPLGVDVAPIGISKPCVAEVGAAGLIAGAGLLGSVLDLFGSQSANETNLEAVRMNNETQKQLAREANEMSQQQFNQNMKWLREQYYDTDQMKRTVESYHKAGVNPALSYGQPVGASSVGAPSQSQFHVAQTEAGHVDPIHIGDGISESVGHAVDAYMNNQLITSQAENLDADSFIKRQNAFTNVQENMARIRNLIIEGDKMLSDRSVSDETKRNIKLQNKYLKKTIKVYSKQMDALAKMPYKQNDVLDSQYEQNMSDAALNYMKVYATQHEINLTDAQIYAIFQKVKQDWKALDIQEQSSKDYSSYLGNMAISSIEHSASEFEELGLSKELLGSQKFKNYVSGVVEGLLGGAGLFFGFRGIRSPKGIKGFAP